MPSAKSSLASGTKVVGQIVTDGDLHVEGQVEGGPLRVGGCLTVAAGATVQCADAEVGEALVIGLFQGTLRSRDVVRIHQSGRVVGDILASRVVFVSELPAAAAAPAPAPAARPAATTPAPRPPSAPPKPATAPPRPAAPPAKPVAEAAPPAGPAPAPVVPAASALPPPPAPPAPSSLSPGSLAMPHAAPPHRVPPPVAAPAPAARVIPTLPSLGQRNMERKD